MSTIINHPALVLTPAFSFWTFGAVRADGCCAYRRKEPKICLSFRLTWVNFLMTIGGMAALFLYSIFYRAREHVGSVAWHELILFIVFLITIAMICLLLIQFLDKCKWLCCGCFCCCCWKKYENCCFPMTQKIVYDTENPRQ